MEKIKIENILLRFKLGQKTLDESTKEMLLLFSDNKQRELLLAFAMRDLKEPVSEFNREGFEKMVDDFLGNNRD